MYTERLRTSPPQPTPPDNSGTPRNPMERGNLKTGPPGAQPSVEIGLRPFSANKRALPAEFCHCTLCVATLDFAGLSYLRITQV